MDLNQSFIESCISELFQKRACFHSEDDFKFSLAWLIKDKIANAEVRLETPFRQVPGEERNRPFYLDLLIRSLGKKIGIELKYKTKELDIDIDGENYFLKSHAAVDLGRNSFCKDIERIETLVSERALDYGFVVFLTNDSTYWVDSDRKRENSYDMNFRIHEGAVLRGTLGWNGPRKQWLPENTYKPIQLKKEYPVTWVNPNSRADKNFRYSIFEIHI